MFQLAELLVNKEMLTRILKWISRLRRAPNSLALRALGFSTVVGSSRVNGPPTRETLGQGQGIWYFYVWQEDGYLMRVGHFNESDAS